MQAYENKQLTRVRILMEQQRFAEAEKLLQTLLSEDPNEVSTLALLAEVNLAIDKPEKAQILIEQAIGLAPDSAVLFYIKARVLLQLDRDAEAENTIREAIALDPHDADCFAFLAHLQLAQKQFAEALDSANEALALEPDNLLALNTRSTALLKLDRKSESYETIEGALREDPNNWYTHANYGWGLLEKGNHKKALEHFKESLKIAPSNHYAQSGMLEAIKATNPFYRLFLKYQFWMSNLTSNYQWGVILGLYFGTKMLNNIANNNKALAPWLTPIVMLLIFFAFSTWVIGPISNLFLRFNKYGQFLLDKKQKISSNFVAGSLLIFLTGLVLSFALKDDRYLSLVTFGFVMMVPFSAMFRTSKYKNLFIYYTIAMALLGIAGIVQTFATGDISNLYFSIFAVGFIAFQLIANFASVR
jgi:tetratricopeptide (TPR) repeat protein